MKEDHTKMNDEPNQTTGDVTPDPGGYLAATMLGIIFVLIGLFSLALIVSAS